MMDDVDVAVELAHQCVRNNTILEDIHAGEELPEKYKEGYSRISQREMKTLMEDIIKNLLLHFKHPEKIALHYYSQMWKAPPEWYEHKERYE